MAVENERLEPAIPEHLRVERTRPLNVSADFVPKHASYSARFSTAVTTLPMLFLGVQARAVTQRYTNAVERIKKQFANPSGPLFWDCASYLDEIGYQNTVLVGYWDSLDNFNYWQDSLSLDWWYSDVEITGDIGVFRECYTPGVSDTETTFSHPHPDGYSKIADHMSGKTDTHEYWGSARDRIPRSQTEALDPLGSPSSDLKQGEDSLGRNILIKPHENLCLLRSGQDWSDTGEQERGFYLRKVKPFLDKGMNEIRDQGMDLGCYFNRYMEVMGKDVNSCKTYSLSAWRSLKDLEEWVKADTHLAIFHAGIQHYKKLGEQAQLRLYHEMSVIKAKDQSFQYFNCHRQTGMLKSSIP